MVHEAVITFVNKEVKPPANNEVRSPACSGANNKTNPLIKIEQSYGINYQLGANNEQQSYNTEVEQDTNNSSPIDQNHGGHDGSNSSECESECVVVTETESESESESNTESYTSKENEKADPIVHIKNTHTGRDRSKKIIQ